MKGTKVAWIIGKNPVNQQKIRERGYEVRQFQNVAQLQQGFDEQPDLIIFSEADIKDFSILSKIRDFFPGVVVLSLPPEPTEVVEMVTKHESDSTLAQSMDRLVSAIRKIEDC
jgi:hypothetical protein